MTVKDVYMSAKQDELMSLIVIIDLLLQHGKIKWKDDSSVLTSYMNENGDKWNRLIQKEFMKRGYVA
ncbi:hypothetical protein PDN54_08110 [Bacillus cereus group sp. Bc252]|uniref:hypothetical protein n=1 Tax=Bacillus TaxID=1386 RepID=UPI0021D1E808|nr:MULTISPECIES: hypothetical protein [Bacillus cereus group]MCU5206763.1 hypothetical protein [Bacillus paranthracis]MDA2160257.1 hypothetical protein [Bacillus cereus group sp. Bc252]HDR7786433.1 hypothetical protein [Bacillus paranthracis]